MGPEPSPIEQTNTTVTEQARHVDAVSDSGATNNAEGITTEVQSTSGNQKFSMMPAKWWSMEGQVTNILQSFLVASFCHVFLTYRQREDLNWMESTGLRMVFGLAALLIYRGVAWLWQRRKLKKDGASPEDNRGEIRSQLQETAAAEGVQAVIEAVGGQ